MKIDTREGADMERTDDEIQEIADRIVAEARKNGKKAGQRKFFDELNKILG